MKSQSQSNSYTSIKRPLSIFYSTNAVRFCLSDGRNWVFSLLTKDEQGNRVCYEGEIFTIIEPRQDIRKAFQADIHKVVELLYHWLSTFANKEILFTIVFLSSWLQATIQCPIRSIRCWIRQNKNLSSLCIQHYVSLVASVVNHCTSLRIKA